MAKLFILAVFAVILWSLGSALLYMIKDRDRDGSKRLARALTWRIALSVALFGLIYVFYLLGWIEPHGITPQ